MTALGKTRLSISWKKVKGVAGYDIFLSRCDHDGKKSSLKKVKTIKGNKTFKWVKSGLKKGLAYKARVKAYIIVDGKKRYVESSPMVHAYTANSKGRYTNAKSLKVNKAKMTLKVGKAFKLKVRTVKKSNENKIMPNCHIAQVRYLSTDKEVAIVTKSGKIKAIGRGTCYVYAFAHNGVSKRIKVTVS
jgi:uncharacterized protein YjdB